MLTAFTNFSNRLNSCFFYLSYVPSLKGFKGIINDNKKV